MRHHTYLEQDVIQINEEIAEENARLSDAKEVYEKYGQRWEKAMPLIEDKQHLKTCVFFCDDRTQKKEKRKFENSLKKAKNLLKKIRDNKEKTL